MMKPVKRIAPLFLACALLAGASGCADASSNEPALETPTKANLTYLTMRRTTFEDNIVRYTHVSYSDFHALNFGAKGVAFLRSYVRVGQDVYAGQLLAEADTTALRDKIATATGDLARAEIDLRELTDTNAEPYEIEKARIFRNQLSTKLASYVRQLDLAKIVAPANGTVVYMNELIMAGQAVSDSEPFILIVGRDRPTIELNVTNSADYFTAALEFGGAEVSLWVNGTKVPARARLAYPDENTFYANEAPSRPVFIEPTDGVTFLKAGDPVKVVLCLKRETDVLTVPTYIIKTVGKISYVRVLRSDGTVADVTITKGSSNGYETVIASGLAEGDKVLYK